MASGIRVEIHSAGARDVLKSREVAEKLKDMGEQIQRAANDQAPEHGYVTEPFAVESGTSDRAYTTVYTRTTLGKRMQASHNALTKAMDAGRM